MDMSDYIVSQIEAETLLTKAKEKWNYDRNDYWLPLVFDDSKADFEWFFVMEHYLRDYYKIILRTLFKGDDVIYYVPLSCIDNNIYKFDSYSFDLFKDECTEYTCMPENVSWIYYHSHEGAVTFAGTIHNYMKKMLGGVKHKWNVFFPG